MCDISASLVIGFDFFFPNLIFEGWCAHYMFIEMGKKPNVYWSLGKSESKKRRVSWPWKSSIEETIPLLLVLTSYNFSIINFSSLYCKTHLVALEKSGGPGGMLHKHFIELKKCCSIYICVCFSFAKHWTCFLKVGAFSCLTENKNES